MSSLDTQYNTDEVMLDKYEEPTQAQWDEIEAADPRYNRPQTRKPKKKGTPKRKKTTKSQKKCLSLLQIARALPDIANVLCFHLQVPDGYAQIQQEKSLYLFVTLYNV